jgi:hypothetical protein
MGARGPKSDEKMKEEWSLICWMIMRNRDLTPPQAERYFGVGKGDGRTWRYWMAGQRLARDYSRTSIVRRARAEGLLTKDNLAVLRKMAAGADVSLLPPLVVPEVGLEITPREAVFELWEWLRERSQSRYMVAQLRRSGLETEYKRLAELVADQVADLDDATALAWIKASYLTLFSRS